MRRALAHQVRQKDQARGPRARGARGVGDDLVRVLAAQLGGHLLAVAEHVAVPAQRAPGREHDAHRVVRARHRVAERVQAHLGIDEEALRVREDDAAGADRGHGAARSHDAEAHRARRVVGGAARDRDARGQAGEARHAVRELPEDPRRVAGRRPERGGDVEGAEHRVAPAARGRVEGEGAARVADVGADLAGEEPARPVLGHEHAVEQGVGVGLVGAQPEQLGEREARERPVLHRAAEPLVAERRADGLALGGGARVAPEDRRAERSPGHVEQDRGVHLAREPDAANAPRAGAERGGEPAEREAERALPVVRVLLGPAEARRRERVPLRRRRLRPPRLLVDRDGLEAARPDVYPDEQAHRVTTRPGASSPPCPSSSSRARAAAPRPASPRAPAGPPSPARAP